MLTSSKHLILVKHSLPEIVKNLSAREWKLSELGRERAQRLAERLKSFQPEVIVCSSEPKAKETAEIIAKAHQLDLRVVDGLHEHDRSNIPYQTKDEFQSAIREFFQKPDRLVYGKETANQAHTRFEQTVLSILNFHPNETVLIVAHGTVISLFVSRLTGISDLGLWNELGLPAFLVIDLGSNSILVKENVV